MLCSRLVLAGCFFASTVTACADDLVPNIPALVVGQKEPASFLVQGILRANEDAAMAWSLATDGKQHVVALYDPFEGTPLILSNGERTFAYDLATNRILVAEKSILAIRLETRPQEEKPINLQFAIGVPAPENLEDRVSSVRVDRFANFHRSKFQLDSRMADFELYTAPRKEKGGDSESFQVKRGDNSWFRFSSFSGGGALAMVEVEASHIGKELPAGALAFPDELKFPQTLNVKTISSSALSLVLAAAQSRLMAPKALLTIGVPANEVAKATYLSRDGLEEKDANLGQKYRAALKEQGIELIVYQRPAKPDQGK